MFKDEKLQFYYDELRKEGWEHSKAVLYCTALHRFPFERLRGRWRRKKQAH